MTAKYMIRWTEDEEGYNAYFDNFAAADLIAGLLTDAGSVAEVWERVTKPSEEVEDEPEADEAEDEDDEDEEDTPKVVRR